MIKDQRITDALGRETSSTFDANGNLRQQTTTVTLADGTVANVITTTVFDTEKHELSKTNAEGETTQYVYDANGQRIASIDPLLRETKFIYDAKGNLVRSPTL